MMYLIAFGTEGLEVYSNMSEWREQEFVDKLKGKRTEPPINFDALSLRFRFNSHRNIECYTIHLDPDIAEVVAQQLANNDENTKQLIRDKGEFLKV